MVVIHSPIDNNLYVRLIVHCLLKHGSAPSKTWIVDHCMA